MDFDCVLFGDDRLNRDHNTNADRETGQEIKKDFERQQGWTGHIEGSVCEIQ